MPTTGAKFGANPFIASTVATLIFVVAYLYDRYTPLGVAGGLIYIIFVMSGLWYRSSVFVFVFAAIGSIMTVVGYFTIEEMATESRWVVQMNRTMSVVVLWFVATLGFYMKRGVVRSKAAESRLNAIIENTVEGIISIDYRGRIRSFNRACEKIFGFRAEEVIGENIKILMPAPYHDEHDGYLKSYRDTGERKIIGIGREVEGKRKDGSVFPIGLSVSEVKVGDTVFYSGIVRDITEAKQAREALFEEKERLRLTLESIGDAVITTDAQGVVEYINPIAEKLTRYSLAEAVNQPLDKIFPIFAEHDRKPCPSPVKQCLEKGKIVGLGNHTLLINHRNEEYSIQDSAAPIRSIDGRILGVIMVFSDVSEQRRLNDQIAFQASHDTLTELANRREFDARLLRVLKNAKAEGSAHALCYLDLDQFKVVNDTCGHVAGDELLRQISIVLRQHIRTRDTLARLGGDEFGILIEHCGMDQANRIAESLRQAVGQYRFVWEDQIFNIGVSVGVVAITKNDESTGELLIKADTACYTAKRAGRNRIHVYEADDTELNVHRGEMEWVSRITRALEKDQFCLFYQPIRSVNGADGLHYELLLRMKGDDGELIAPGAFMPAAERYALTTKIDCWVIENAFGWLRTHPDHLTDLFQCAINLSGFSLGSREVLEEIIKQLDDDTVSAQKICFEITETAAITNLRYASQFIDRLSALGCQFALDDFGSGLSSFGYLKNLSVDYLKIDGVFVKNIVDNPTDRAMVKSINEIGHVMGKKTIAEFAENDEIIECLTGIGVDFVQGFGVGHPMPIENIELLCT